MAEVIKTKYMDKATRGYSEYIAKDLNALQTISPKEGDRAMLLDGSLYICLNNGQWDIMAAAEYGGGAELNIAYGETAPEDTSKLWIKANEPNKLLINNGNAESAKIAASYIEATGTQYIDTGYIPNENTKIIIILSDIVNPSYHNNNILFSATTSWANETFCFTYHNQTSSGIDGGGFRWMGASTYFKYGENTPKATIELYRDYIKYNGQVLQELGTTNYAYNDLATLRLFGGARFTDPYAVEKGYRLYSLQIIENDEVIKDYIPIYHKGRDEAGLFDRVSGTYLFNQGTGKFNYEIHAYELTQGNIELQTSLTNNIFKLINTDSAQVEIGVESVYIGNENNEAEKCEAYLYQNESWVQI